MRSLASTETANKKIQLCTRHVLRLSHVLPRVYIHHLHNGKHTKKSSTPHSSSIKLSDNLHQEVTIMTPSPPKKGKNNAKATTPPTRLKPPEKRPSSTHSPTSSSSPSLRRSSTTSSIPRSRKSTSPSQASTGRPEWIAPPGKPCSPTSIPVPTFLDSARRRKSPLRLGSGPVKKEGDVSVRRTPLTPAGQLRGGDEVEIRSLPLGEVNWDETEMDTPSELPGRRTDILNRSGQVRAVELKPSPRGLGLTFAASPLQFSSPPTELPTPTSASATQSRSPTSASSPESFALKFRPTAASLGGKHDSLSPASPTSSTFIHLFETPVITTPLFITPFKHKRHLSPPTALPPSPSTLHPHISKTHITPSCTTGALTHRLSCGHLICTLRPEPCARNCGIEGISFGSARLKAQGFARGYRGLDDSFICPVCTSFFFQNIEIGQDVETAIEQLGRDFNVGSDELWIARKEELVWLLRSGSRVEVSAMIKGLGKHCSAVLEPTSFAEDYPSRSTRKAARCNGAPGKEKSIHYPRLQDRFDRKVEWKYHVKLLQREENLKRLTAR
ncbi:hypothetical protein E4T39_05033 [Aureobasidium subglaciale]|nr:hypothetical protein E4T39_05033 [Aureobasidium subglaciale]